MKYPRAVDRIPYSAMLETHAEHPDPPVEKFRLPLRTRWRLVTGFKPWTTWRHAWKNVVFLVRG